jgi:hypothetical protein
MVIYSTNKIFYDDGFNESFQVEHFFIKILNIGSSALIFSFCDEENLDGVF